MGVVETIRYLPEFINIVRKGEYTGDAVILKSTFGRFEPSERIKSFIQSKCQNTPDFSDIDFATFKEGSFGREYDVFMKRQGLKPFRFSGRYKDLMSKNYLPIFYASVHDFFHVLTGYDASFAGEAGVWSFVTAQDISPQSIRASKMAQLFFPMVKPGQRQLIKRAGTEGSQMGRTAKPILTMDFRSELNRPLSEVRARYDIEPTAIHELMMNRS